MSSEMLHKKWNRRLSFEQLDNRIAMNSDMHPSLSIGTGASLFRDVGQQLEMRSRSISTLVVLQSFSQRDLHFPPSRHHHEMELQAEGEARVNVSFAPLVFSRIAFAPSATAPLKISTDLATVIQSLARSEPNHLLIEVAQPSSPVASRNQNQIAVQTGSRGFTPPSLTVAANSLSPSPSVNAAPRSIGSPAPTAATSPTIASSALKLGSNSSSMLNHPSVLNTNLQSEKPTVSMEFGQPLRLLSDANVSANGMLSFEMRESNDSPLGSGHPSRSALETARDYSRNVRMDQPTASARTAEMIHNPNRLPAPKGMIEIRDNDLNHPERMTNKVLSKAGANPFEILQWFVGSTNMVQKGNTPNSLPNASATIGNDVEQVESTELATKQEAILALATGALFVIAIRQSHRHHALKKQMLVSVQP